MCYKKPGPRCSDHAAKALAQAESAHYLMPSADTEIALQKAQEDWSLTPKGIKEYRDAAYQLLERGDLDGGVAQLREADARATRREELIALAKGETDDHAAEIASEVARLSALPEDELMYQLTWDQRLTPQVLEGLASSPSARVRRAVLNHANVSEQVVGKILETKAERAEEAATEVVDSDEHKSWFEISSVDAETNRTGHTTITVTMNSSDGGYDSAQPEMVEDFLNRGYEDFDEIAGKVNEQLDGWHSATWDKEADRREEATRAVIAAFARRDGMTEAEAQSYTTVRFVRTPYSDVDAAIVSEFAPDEAQDAGW